MSVTVLAVLGVAILLLGVLLGGLLATVMVDRHYGEHIEGIHAAHRDELNALHAAHREQLENIIDYARTKGPSVPEVAVVGPMSADQEDHAILRKQEIAAMAEYIAQEKGCSAERAIEEAEAMIAKLGT